MQQNKISTFLVKIRHESHEVIKKLVIFLNSHFLDVMKMWLLEIVLYCVNVALNIISWFLQCFSLKQKCIWNITKFYDILYAYLISRAEWIYFDAFLTYDLLFTSNHERKGREKIELNSVNRGKKNCFYIALVQFGFSLSLNWYYFTGVTSFYRHVCRK